MSILRDPPDARLLHAAREGDSDAFGVFYLRHRDPLTRFCARRVGTPEAVADLVAETFATALEVLHGPRPPKIDDAAGWLFGMARNKIADTYRRGAVDDRARQRIGMERLDLQPDEAERILDLAEPGDAVRVAAGLPEDQRRAIYGRIVAQDTYEELSAELGVPESTVRKRVSRALTTIKTRLTETHA
ncbi:RNA polymerase sigma factor [Patulibacter minatonensis]|uniref:RNA polymerase sigma factor n=1 Tax=Patulibacter minatonensis TaxID=298163 RepID=UPI00047A58BD|nr:RNA polymerase sigma factor [Patulibacter minatonensis]